MKKGWAGVVCTVQFILLTQTVMQEREFLNNPEECRCFFYIITPGFGVVHYHRSSVAMELALFCCSNHHMQIPCTSCKDTPPCQQGSSPMVGQGELSWKSRNSNKWQCCQNLIFCMLRCLFLSVPPAVPQNMCSINTLQSNLPPVPYLPTRASVPPNIAALCIYSLPDSHSRAQCSQDVRSWWLKALAPSLPAQPGYWFCLSASCTHPFDQNNPGLWSEFRFELYKLGFLSLTKWAFFSLSSLLQHTAGSILVRQALCNPF